MSKFSRKGRKNAEFGGSEKSLLPADARISHSLAVGRSSIHDTDEPDENADGEKRLVPRAPQVVASEETLIDVSDTSAMPDLASLVEKLTEEQLLELHECFTMFDKDGSGSVDFLELGRILLSLGQKLTDEELRQMISEVDVNNSGDVDFEEFCALMAWQMYSSGEEQQLRSIFACLDQTRSGHITKSHIRFVLANICPNLPTLDIDDMLLSMRGDSLSFKQFYNIFQETLPNVVDAKDTLFASETADMYKHAQGD